MEFRSSDKEIVNSDMFSDIRVDTRRSSVLGKTYKLGAKVGSSVVDLVGKTVGDVVKQQIRAAGGTNSNETMADSQGRAVKTSLQNAEYDSNCSGSNHVFRYCVSQEKQNDCKINRTDI